MSHVTHINESWLIHYTDSNSAVAQWVMSHISMSHDSIHYTDSNPAVAQWVMSHTSMSHESIHYTDSNAKNEKRWEFERNQRQQDQSGIYMQSPHSCHTYQWVMPHISMSHDSLICVTWLIERLQDLHAVAAFTRIIYKHYNDNYFYYRATNPKKKIKWLQKKKKAVGLDVNLSELQSQYPYASCPNIIIIMIFMIRLQIQK